MMKKSKIVTLAAVFCSSYFIRAQNVEWVSIIGGAETDQYTQEAGEHITFDKDGNVLLSAYFEGGSCNRDNAPLISTGSSFINGVSLKVDAGNSYITHSHMPNGQLWHQNALADGSEYGCGSFFDSTQIGAVALHTTPFTLSGFVFRKDASGNVLWANKFDGPNAVCEVRASAVDANGNIYVAGMFQGTVSFGGISKTSAVYSGAGPQGRRNMDGYVVKYNANGNVLWVKTVRGPAEDRIEAIKWGADGHIYVTGSFEGGPAAPFHTDFFGGIQKNTTGPFTSADLFVAKVDNAGSLKWVRTGGGNYNDFGEAVDVDKDGNVYVGGDYGSSATFEGQHIDSVNFTLNFLLNKYDAQGNLLWIQTGVGPGYDVARSVKVGEDGKHIYVTGVVSDNAVFQTDTVHGFGGEDILFASFNSNGSLIDVYAMGADGEDRGHSIDIHPQTGALFITGYCSAGAEFGNKFTTGYGGPDIFLAKIEAPNYVGINEYGRNAFNVSVYPNPSQGLLTIENSTTKGLLEVYDVTGRVLFTRELSDTKEQIDISAFEKGIYSLTVTRGSKDIYRTRFIKN